MVRSALAAAQVRVAGELDVSDSIQQQLRVRFSPCRILFVDTPYLLLESMVFDRSAATLLPLHLVVSGRGNHTRVEWISLARMDGARCPAEPALLARLHRQLSEALNQVAIREDTVCLDTAN